MDRTGRRAGRLIEEGAGTRGTRSAAWARGGRDRRRGRLQAGRRGLGAQIWRAGRSGRAGEAMSAGAR
jgi:hypothetical protein